MNEKNNMLIKVKKFKKKSKYLDIERKELLNRMSQYEPNIK